ncbi:TPA: hypothetical protein HA318_05025 [Candidatus Micrarchaeota archaeon]|nr:MAG: hypothetical protein AUJ65_05910 [Candidatus Micrarchaeota archaeon CG1_02_51_15]HII39335.1 hypothetical protein [Candidatus Micrarchaeota archaeon]
MTENHSVRLHVLGAVHSTFTPLGEGRVYAKQLRELIPHLDELKRQGVTCGGVEVLQVKKPIKPCEEPDSS